MPSTASESPPSAASDTPDAALSRTDLVAGLIGAEAGAAIGLLFFGGTPLLPIGVTLGFAVAGPVALRASRPVRLRVYRHWLRTQLHTNPQA